MKKIIPVILLAALFVFSCSEGKKEEEETKEKGTTETVDSTATDEVVITYTPEVEALLPRFTKAESPLQIDSAFFKNIDFERLEIIRTDVVKQLTAMFAEDELHSQYTWDIKNYYKIDSIKVSGGYEEYVANLDIGMMKEFDAWAYQNITIDEKTNMLVWIMDYSTYEACPYAAGTMIMATVVYEGAITQCHILGEQMSAGDAPVGMLRLIYSTIDAEGYGTFDIHEEHTGEDENYELVEEVSDKGHKLEIVEGKIQISTR